METSKFLDKYVRITLKTGQMIDGFLSEYGDECATVECTANDNYTVIFNPQDNIVMIGVFAEEPEGVEDDIQFSDEVEDRRIADPEAEPLDHYEPNENLRALKLAELHLEKKDALKDQLAHHFQNKTVRLVPEEMYDTPDFTQRSAEDNTA